MTQIEDVLRVRANVVRFPMERRQDRAPIENTFIVACGIAIGIAGAIGFIWFTVWPWICFFFSR